MKSYKQTNQHRSWYYRESEMPKMPYLKLEGLIEQWVVLVLSSSACPLFSTVSWDTVQLQDHIGVNDLSLSP